MQRRQFLAAAGAALLLPAGARAEDGPVRMRDLYNKDLSFSDYAKAMEGRRIAVQGFMAPPLKAESTFFVLTKRPMAVCPFCESEAEWPDDILAVYASRVIDTVPFNVKIVTSGTLELGTYEDPDLGFVSRVRLSNAVYERS
ncbi:hypothetical protein E3C22_16915 [Jiella endophytica]|uniref:DUF3299 domain-containing protein n=1 Tax=Jiella endophytica TaxID=2558362 RepID=A0A4Y8RET3_9HYPH|nr:hypothetical protein [Jiella endophytica]TFF20584.1 hypothetical protein E3C22_16915 [Jiella endophytica]